MPSSSDRRLQARAAAYARAAMYDGKVVTEAARAGRWAKLLATVDPDGALPEPERVRRAEALRKSQLFSAALKSARVRRMKKAADAPKSAPATDTTEGHGNDLVAA